MSFSVILKLFIVVCLLRVIFGGASLEASSKDLTQGCVIPESGPQKGILPQGCSDESKAFPSEQKLSQVRCRIVDVKCDSKTQGGYIAVAKVEQWLKGTGPSQIEFKFLKNGLKTKKNLKILEAGKGLCADLTLEKTATDWFLKKVENPTSSSDLLPSCP